MQPFQLNNIPDQQGKIAIVTGANTGIGYETALELAKKKITVILACRNLKKAAAAKDKITALYPDALLDCIALDLSSLASVREFAEQFLKKYARLDLLINNAGVMIPPYQKTTDGFELQFGVNHLGHFLLTGLLMDRLLSTAGSRVVVLSSIAHKRGLIQFDDLQWEKKYSKFKSYAQSKLANLMFAYELDRRLRKKSGHSCIALAVHPGVSNTELARHMPKLVYFLLTPLIPFATHPPAKAALPSLMAALWGDAKGGDYYGPQGRREMKGPPGPAEFSQLSKDEGIAERLWAVSEELVGFEYKL